LSGLKTSFNWEIDKDKSALLKPPFLIEFLIMCGADFIYRYSPIIVP